MFAIGHGGRILFQGVQDLLRLQGKIHQTTLPKTPKENGVAECPNRKLIESVRLMIEQAKLVNQFWAEIFVTD